jgi:hypothetical protein
VTTSGDCAVVIPEKVSTAVPEGSFTVKSNVVAEVSPFAELKVNGIDKLRVPWTCTGFNPYGSFANAAVLRIPTKKIAKISEKLNLILLISKNLPVLLLFFSLFLVLFEKNLLCTSVMAPPPKIDFLFSNKVQPFG